MTDSFHLYFNGTQVFARRKTGLAWPRRVMSVGSWTWNGADLSSLNLAPLKVPKNSRARLHAYVGSAFCRFMAADLPAGLRGPSEQKAAAQAQIQHQLGLNGAEWHFAVDVFALPARSIVCAIRRDLIERIRCLSTENALRLVSLKPYMAGIWNTFEITALDRTAQQAALVAIESDASTVFVAQKGALQAVSTLAHRWEDGLVDREIKRLGWSFGMNDEQDIHLALPAGRLEMAHPHAARILGNDMRLKKTVAPDFSDMLFAASEVRE